MFGIIMLIVGALVIIGGLIALVVGIKEKAPEISVGGTAASVVGVILIAMMCFTIIPARTVGVVVEFGQPKKVLENGPHAIAPYAKVEKFDLAMQENNYQQGEGGDSRVNVRLGNSSQAMATASIQWQLKPDGMIDTYNDYREMDAIRYSLVDRNFRDALNTVMATYDPIREAGNDENSREELAKQAQEIMEKRIGDKIIIRSIIIPTIEYDEMTQNRINELQQEIANTRIAEQRANTVKQEAENNALIEESLTEESLINKCLEIARENNTSPLGCVPQNGIALTKPVD